MAATRIDVKKAGWRNPRTSRMQTDIKKFNEGMDRIFGNKEKENAGNTDVVSENRV